MEVNVKNTPTQHRVKWREAEGSLEARITFDIMISGVRPTVQVKRRRGRHDI
jgi:hypothetical protein